MVILLAFLFLVATTLAVLFYVRDDEGGKELIKEQAKSSKLVNESRGKTAVIDKMVLKMAGRTLGPDAAIEEADQMLKLEHARDYAALSLATKEMNGKIAALTNQVKQGILANIDLNKELVKKDGTIKNVSEGLMKQKADVQQELTDAKKKYEDGLTDKQAQLDNADAEFKAVINQKDQRINAMASELDDKSTQIQQLQDRVDLLSNMVRDLKGPVGNVGELLVSKPSGKIAKVSIEQGICYIDLGQKDRATAGLSFSVFPAQTGIPKDGKPKAKIVVVNVGDTISECRIVESSKNDPIIEGDLLINVVFSSARTYNCVVEGEFDLYGTGKTDPLANLQVRTLIENFGGKVADAISINTDFVIMGDEPPRPPKPPDDAPPAVLRAYLDAMKTYDYYKQVKASAIALQIPVLNTNRFLAFSGYVPKKRLTEYIHRYDKTGLPRSIAGACSFALSKNPPTCPAKPWWRRKRLFISSVVGTSP